MIIYRFRHLDFITDVTNTSPLIINSITLIRETMRKDIPNYSTLALFPSLYGPTFPESQFLVEWLEQISSKSFGEKDACHLSPTPVIYDQNLIINTVINTHVTKKEGCMLCLLYFWIVRTYYVLPLSLANM